MPKASSLIKFRESSNSTQKLSWYQAQPHPVLKFIYIAHHGDNIYSDDVARFDFLALYQFLVGQPKDYHANHKRFSNRFIRIYCDTLHNVISNLFG